MRVCPHQLLSLCRRIPLTFPGEGEKLVTKPLVKR